MWMKLIGRVFHIDYFCNKKKKKNRFASFRVNIFWQTGDWSIFKSFHHVLFMHGDEWIYVLNNMYEWIAHLPKVNANLTCKKRVTTRYNGCAGPTAHGMECSLNLEHFGLLYLEKNTSQLRIYYANYMTNSLFSFLIFDTFLNIMKYYYLLSGRPRFWCEKLSNTILILF